MEKEGAQVIIPAIALAARLFMEGKRGRLKGTPNVRKTLRADCLIVATAAIHGAQVFYSNDRDCRMLVGSGTRMKAEDLPDMPPELLVDLES